MVGSIGEDFVVKRVREVVLEVEFESALCALRRKQREELVDVI